MKKKLKALDVRLQLAGVGVLLILVAVLGYMMVVSPQKAQAAKVASQVTAEQSLIYQREAELRAGLHPPTIETADLFRLARAMPDTQDMPGIMLTLSQLASDAGISLNLIEPMTGGPAPAGSYQTFRLHVQFDGDFYGLSDFLYRVRSLVSVHDGKLDASGRLFNVDTLSFNADGTKFPQISADLDLDAYVYSSAAATPSTGTTPTTTTDTTQTDTTTTSTDESLPSGATAAAAN